MSDGGHRAPGLKLGFTVEEVAVTLGPFRSNITLNSCQTDGQDRHFMNVTTNDATHLLTSPSTPGVKLTTPISPPTFDKRIMDWAYGVPIGSTYISKGEKTVNIPSFGRTTDRNLGDNPDVWDFSKQQAADIVIKNLGTNGNNPSIDVAIY
ncbi:hypothetical protein B2J93_3989 [Marssonina coronariae]|uniref:Uncharacterized protein n=1 Tax=Diplocarpon coronariae TaxID=2795749 RepID=A0A218YYW0_9HELO|nr:hypothetical protein B2J93_3989 [Marssonina coronariae]